ncbi:MAG: hypothetical protein N4A74_26135 [Carboxylicivirga sp.]|jgi:hypothetical protein|nr:hypothetical protein [Carboxylicivirga sp.]
MKNSSLIFTGLVIVVLGAVISVNWELFQVDPNLFENGASIFFKYLVIVIAVERAAQVYIGIRHEENKKNIETRIRNIEKQSKPLKSLIEEGKLTDDDRLNDIQDKLYILEQDEADRNIELTDHKNKVRAIALKVVFIAGIVLAIGGLSILSDIFYTPDSWSDCSEGACKIQMYIYRVMDILITGGLIGGGSKSFHQFLSSIESYAKSRS